MEEDTNDGEDAFEQIGSIVSRVLMRSVAVAAARRSQQPVSETSHSPDEAKESDDKQDIDHAGLA